MTGSSFLHKCKSPARCLPVATPRPLAERPSNLQREMHFAITLRTRFSQRKPSVGTLDEFQSIPHRRIFSNSRLRLGAQFTRNQFSKPESRCSCSACHLRLLASSSSRRFAAAAAVVIVGGGGVGTNSAAMASLSSDSVRWRR